MTVGYTNHASFLSVSAEKRGTADLRSSCGADQSLSGALKIPVRHEHGWASIDRVWRELDGKAARYLCANVCTSAGGFHLWNLSAGTSSTEMQLGNLLSDPSRAKTIWSRTSVDGGLLLA